MALIVGSIRTMSSINHIWSTDLQQQTRDFIRDIQVSPFDGALHFKHGDGHFAVCGFQDLACGKLSLTEEQTGKVFEFADVDTLLDEGWVID